MNEPLRIVHKYNHYINWKLIFKYLSIEQFFCGLYTPNEKQLVGRPTAVHANDWSQVSSDPSGDLVNASQNVLLIISECTRKNLIASQQKNLNDIA